MFITEIELRLEKALDESNIPELEKIMIEMPTSDASDFIKNVTPFLLKGVFRYLMICN